MKGVRPACEAMAHSTHVYKRLRMTPRHLRQRTQPRQRREGQARVLQQDCRTTAQASSPPSQKGYGLGFCCFLFFCSSPSLARAGAILARRQSLGRNAEFRVEKRRWIGSLARLAFYVSYNPRLEAVEANSYTDNASETQERPESILNSLCSDTDGVNFVP